MMCPDHSKSTGEELALHAVCGIVDTINDDPPLVTAVENVVGDLDDLWESFSGDIVQQGEGRRCTWRLLCITERLRVTHRLLQVSSKKLEAVLASKDAEITRLTAEIETLKTAARTATRKKKPRGAT